jgi:hypothetical protein
VKLYALALLTLLALAALLLDPLSAAAVGLAAGLLLARAPVAPTSALTAQTIDYLADDAALLYHLVVNPSREVCRAS